MYLSFRWYAESDTIPLEYVRQIPGIRSVVAALYDLAPGEVWPEDRLAALRRRIEAADLAFRVVESIPVPEAIKLGTADRDQAIDRWIQSLKAVGRVLGPASLVQNGANWPGRAQPVVITYNFMPVFDWTRSQLAKQLPDGSTTLAYDAAVVGRMDPLQGELELPGWLARYQKPELAELLAAYRTTSAEAVYNNLVYFLKAVCPEAERAGVRLALHPDDPPWPVFDIPRIASNAAGLRRLLSEVPSVANSLCLCTGSLGVSPENNVSAMIREFSSRIAFMHLRNVKITGAQSFEETAHPSYCGDLDMAEIVGALVASGYHGPIRPDHGRMIWGESGKPGYGLYDRALGAAYLEGLIEQARKQHV